MKESYEPESMQLCEVDVMRLCLARETAEPQSRNYLDSVALENGNT